MANLGKFRVGDKDSEIQIIVQDTSAVDVNAAYDLTNITAIDGIQLTIIDPDGNILGPFNMTKVNPPGVDGLVQYITSHVTSIWTKGGMWRWFATVFPPATSAFSTNDAIREVLE